MDAEHWQQVDDIFQAVVEMDCHERGAFLDSSCSGDDSLRMEVESLLDADQQEFTLFATPVFDMVTRLLGTDAPELSAGQYFGHYKILDLLGAGGMGEVYLAHDNSLGRRVALKLLPSEFNVDDERTRRFQQEARAASALNHPNILTIYHIGQFDDRRFIATEYIEGRTLRQVFRESTLDVIEAVDVATQIAGALTAAHQAGIVHRDIKPENIMLRPDGYVKVLDFGLAKLTEKEASSADTDVRTQEQLDTRSGVVLGTVKYMSPEQARGLKVDGRSDIFSLSVLLYEMVAGRAPFEGPSTSDLIVSILTAEPAPLSEYSSAAPAELQRIVSKGLSKSREDRYQSANDLLLDLKSLRQDLQLELKIQRVVESSGSSRSAALPKGARINRKSMSAALLALTLASVLGAGYGVYRLLGLGKSTHFQNIRMSRVTTSGRASGAAISPDGRYVAYLDREGGKQGLWIRQVATSSNVLIVSSTSISGRLTFSPDGNYLYYVAQIEGDSHPALYQAPAMGGTPRKVMTGVSSSVAFSPDGSRIAFVRDDAKESAMMIANADGSEERRVAVRQSPDSFASTAWSPDGKRLACGQLGRDNDGFYGEVVEIDVEGGNQRPITDRRWTNVEEITWLSDGSALMIIAAEETHGLDLIWKVSYPDGEVRPVTSDLNDYAGLSLTKDSSTIVSTQAIAIYNLYVRTGEDGGVAQITSGSARKDGWCGISWTPEGRIVYSSRANGHPDIWSMRPDGSDQKQLTVGLGSDNLGLSVSPDGRYIVFVSHKAGRPHVWRVDIDGGNAKQLTNGAGEFNPFFAPDGLWVFYRDGNEASPTWKVPIDGGDPIQLTGAYSVLVARGISPDAKLIAYKPSDHPVQARKMGIASIDDGRFIRILDIPRYLEWTVDGRALTYIDRRGGVANLWMQPVDGNAATQLTNFNERESNMNTFAWSRDGKYLAFSLGRESFDVVLIRSVE